MHQRIRGLLRCCSVEPQIMDGESLPQSKDDASLIAVYPSKQPTMLPAHTHSPLSPLISQAFSLPTRRNSQATLVAICLPVACMVQKYVRHCNRLLYHSLVDLLSAQL